MVSPAAGELRAGSSARRASPPMRSRQVTTGPRKLTDATSASKPLGPSSASRTRRTLSARMQARTGPDGRTESGRGNCPSIVGPSPSATSARPSPAERTMLPSRMLALPMNSAAKRLAGRS